MNKPFTIGEETAITGDDDARRIKPVCNRSKSSSNFSPTYTVGTDTAPLVSFFFLMKPYCEPRQLKPLPVLSDSVRGLVTLHPRIGAAKIHPRRELAAHTLCTFGGRENDGVRPTSFVTRKI